MNRHPAEGARIILETEQHLDLAAVVAYEHHIRLDGKGYPSFSYARKCHQASDLTHVCDVFDALRTDRPYRPALATDVVLNMIEEGAGKEFTPDLAQAMVQMIRQWEMRIAEIEDEDQPLPIAAGAPDPQEGSGGGSGPPGGSG